MDSGQPPVESALQAGPGVQQMPGLSVDYVQHSLPPGLAGLLATRGEKP